MIAFKCLLVVIFARKSKHKCSLLLRIATSKSVQRTLLVVKAIVTTKLQAEATSLVEQ